jgi:hypothetical protein
MGKIDDMRRLREQQFAATNDDKSAAKKASAGVADDQGKCSACGKMKPLTNGLVANHQKGFGKACPGSRKEPA